MKKPILKAVGLIAFLAVTALTTACAPTTIRQPLPSLPVTTQPAIQATAYPTNQPWGYGPGMMGRGGPGNGSWGMGPGMMGGNASQGWGYTSGGTPLTLEQAVESARQYLASYANPDLVLTEVMEFSSNFYAEVAEQSTGVHAFEFLIDRFTGYAYPEPGPNMMWNTKYGHMGGMMGGWGTSQTGALSVSPEQAQEIAQQWLDRYLPGTSIAQEADAFYGYYTIHVMKGDQIYGMLSVNGYTGEVWYHTWHGDFINMIELEAEK